jgi:hypothetical protein
MAKRLRRGSPPPKAVPVTLMLRSAKRTFSPSPMAVVMVARANGLTA